MLKAYKYRIYPNKEQKIQIVKTFGCCRFVYNQTLSHRKKTYENEKRTISKTDCNNYCNTAHTYMIKVRMIFLIIVKACVELQN